MSASCSAIATEIGKSFPVKRRRRIAIAIRGQRSLVDSSVTMSMVAKGLYYALMMLIEIENVGLN